MIGYVSLDEAKEFLKNRYEEVSEQELSKGLYKALDKIESLMIRDSGKSDTQELIFPRINEKEVPAETTQIRQIIHNDIFAGPNGLPRERSIGRGDLSRFYNNKKNKF